MRRAEEGFAQRTGAAFRVVPARPRNSDERLGELLRLSAGWLHLWRRRVASRSIGPCVVDADLPTFGTMKFDGFIRTDPRRLAARISARGPASDVRARQVPDHVVVRRPAHWAIA